MDAMLLRPRDIRALAEEYAAKQDVQSMPVRDMRPGSPERDSGQLREDYTGINTGWMDRWRVHLPGTQKPATYRPRRARMTTHPRTLHSNRAV